MNTFFYIYVLRSLNDGDFYTGYTHDLRKRIDEHRKGAVPSTKHGGGAEP
ncbi:MAG: GIY-YIG nuclease family protein [Verrucomicrobia bacterium]|nr:GIY-YIG nuclease family protein [Verrucomicrobiota bacterium]